MNLTRGKKKEDTMKPTNSYKLEGNAKKNWESHIKIARFR